MPRITPVDYRILLKIFQMFGCIYKRKKGSHHILNYPGAKRAVVIPEYEEVDVEIIKNNMRTVGMTRDQYFELLKQATRSQLPAGSGFVVSSAERFETRTLILPGWFNLAD